MPNTPAAFQRQAQVIQALEAVRASIPALALSLSGGGQAVPASLVLYGLDEGALHPRVLLDLQGLLNAPGAQTRAQGGELLKRWHTIPLQEGANAFADAGVVLMECWASDTSEPGAEQFEMLLAQVLLADATEVLTYSIHRDAEGILCGFQLRATRDTLTGGRLAVLPAMPLKH